MQNNNTTYNNIDRLYQNIIHNNEQIRDRLYQIIISNNEQIRELNNLNTIALNAINSLGDNPSTRVSRRNLNVEPVNTTPVSRRRRSSIVPSRNVSNVPHDNPAGATNEFNQIVQEYITHLIRQDQHETSIEPTNNTTSTTTTTEPITTEPITTEPITTDTNNINDINTNNITYTANSNVAPINNRLLSPRQLNNRDTSYLFEYIIPVNSTVNADYYFNMLVDAANNQHVGVNNFYDPVNICPTTEQIQTATRHAKYRDIVNPKNMSCPISLDNFNDEDDVIIIRHCKHVFKPNELMRWFTSNCKCPVCRYDIRNYVHRENSVI